MRSLRRFSARRRCSQVIVADGRQYGWHCRTGPPRGRHCCPRAGKGYGRACLLGAQAAEAADIIVFMDGDGADDPATIATIVAPIRAGNYDFVIGSRARGDRTSRAVFPITEILAGQVARDG